MLRFQKESVIAADPGTVFAFHELPDALQRLTPPRDPVKILQPAKNLRVGSTALVEIRFAKVFKIRWLALHTAYEPPRMFEDVQLKGPFRNWKHKHIVKPHKAGSLLRDEVEYELPFGFFGKFLAGTLVENRLEKLFNYRHKVTREWCEGPGKTKRTRFEERGYAHTHSHLEVS